jgi:hypothetical protein
LNAARDFGFVTWFPEQEKLLGGRSRAPAGGGRNSDLVSGARNCLTGAAGRLPEEAEILPWFDDQTKTMGSFDGRAAST